MSAITREIGPDGRVLIIGLDGASWTNLQPRARSGEMPTLQKLLNEGAWGILNSTVPALTPPAWASLVTGTNPGKHGVYHFRHTAAGEYYPRRLNTSRDIHAPTLWQRVGQYGRQVGVINVPLSSPVYPVNGFITSDAFAPDLKNLTVHPPELEQEFKNVTPDVSNYPTARPGTGLYRDQMLAFIKENERVLNQHADVAVRLMRARPWQFFMVVWLILDRLQHYAWKFCDPAGVSALQSSDEQQIAARCTAAFKQIDAQIARLIEAAGEDCTVILVSDHGFGPVAGAFFHTNRWLARQGYLRLLPAWHWRRWALGNFPRAWRSRWKLPLDAKLASVDWEATRVWADCLEARAIGLRINRSSRYPQGIVSDLEYAPLRDRLIAELRQIEAPDGRKVFFEVYPAEELYRGPHAAAAPDLVAILNKPFDGPPGFRRDLASRQLITPNTHVLRDGGHEPEGIFVLWGRQIRPATQLPPQRIESIAPTVLRLLGLPVGEDIDGEPIAAALREDVMKNRSATEPLAAMTAEPGSSPPPEYSDKDSALVEERLRKLGYLD